MFKSLLIANRGEIACRIIKTAQKMGIQTIAVYSTVDKDSLHTQLADQAFCLGDPKATSSYLNSEAILAVAKQSGAQAVHPGYGFLSENSAFALACEKAGLVFIGPGVGAMQAMASKQLAKQLLEKTTVPLTPGYHGMDQSDGVLLKEAEKMGYPIVIKAANGGGGKGMRTVLTAENFLQALAGARREATASFGDNTMILEKYVLNPRHVEVQLMADNFGHVVHVFERDCSIQRRHQKIIEEAPAPHLSSSLRDKLTKAACEVARTIEYRGAGTVEFLVDENEAFYFMEMNTRLQVEHPVTEAITGLDLVAWQLRIADNQPLPCTQEAITSHGHAIECRIYAEDSTRDALPSIGRIDFLHPPQGEGLRLDSGITCGSQITQYYDPLLAKLIAWGETREQALYRLTLALEQYAIGGVKTNIPLLQAIIQTPRFQQAKLTTGFLTEENLTLPTLDPLQGLFFAAMQDYMDLQDGCSALAKATLAWQMHLTRQWISRYQIDDQLFELTLIPIDSTTLTVIWENTSTTLWGTRKQDTLYIDTGKEQLYAFIHAHGDTIDCTLRGVHCRILRMNEVITHNLPTKPKGHLTAPMPATVVAILKKTGDTVTEGEPLMILEAMKMEHRIHAPKSGIIHQYYFTVGAQVPEGAELLAMQD